MPGANSPRLRRSTSRVAIYQKQWGLDAGKEWACETLSDAGGLIWVFSRTSVRDLDH